MQEILGFAIGFIVPVIVYAVLQFTPRLRRVRELEQELKALNIAYRALSDQLIRERIERVNDE